MLYLDLINLHSKIVGMYMRKIKVVFLASSALVAMASYATSIVQLDIISLIKQGEQAECIGVKKVITHNKVSFHKDNKVDISFNESGTFEATEQDTSDLGGYSPIPYPCKYIDGFTSTDLNITNKKAFICKDESYVTTEEVYLLKNCKVQGR